MNDEIDRAALRATIAVLKRFSQFDHKMQISTVQTLLEVAEGKLRGDSVSVQDIEKRVGLQSGTASRNVYYWGDGANGVTGAHQMVSIGFDPTDRRKRTIGLTAKGRTFLKDVFKSKEN